MSNSIDTRIVEMQFDNKEFEKGVKKTMSSLDDLKKKLEFDNVNTGISELSRKFDVLSASVSMIGGGVSKLTGAFTTLWGSLKAKTIDRAADYILNTAQKIGRALTFEGIQVGKGKYEEKMTSMRTIMAATGKTAQQVEETLKKLMEYSDLTSYSFSEMSSYIGNFTSVGIDLDKAEVAMEGIANACARVGINSSEAGRAMREFAQAMAAGSMERINYKTLSQMNFADKRFKEEIIATAKALGTLNEEGYVIKDGKVLKKAGKVTYQNFEDMLKYEFMSTEVMMETLTRYADRNGELGKASFEAAKEARSFKDAIEAIKDSISTGWSKTWEQIFGNVDEAAEFFTEFCDSIIDDFISPLNEAKEALFEGWRERGGRKSMIAALRDTWTVIKDLGRAVKDAYANVFGRLTSSGLAEATDQVRQFVEAIKEWLHTRTDDGLQRIDHIRHVLMGIAGVFKIAKLAIGGFVSFIGRIIGMFLPDVGDVTKSFGDVGFEIAKFAEQLEKEGTIGKFFDGLADKIAPFIKDIPKFFEKVGNKIKETYDKVASSPIFQKISDAIVKFWNDIPKYWEVIKDFFKDAYKTVTSHPIFIAIRERLMTMFEALPGAFEKVKNWFSDIWKTGGGTIKGFLKEAGKRIWAAILEFIKDLPNKWEVLKGKIAILAKNLGTWITTNWTKLKPKIGKVFSDLFAALPEGWNDAKNWIVNTFNDVVDFFRKIFTKTDNQITAAAQEVSNASSAGGSSGGKTEEQQKNGPFAFLTGVVDFLKTWKDTFPARAILYSVLIVAVLWKVVAFVKSIRDVINAYKSIKFPPAKKKSRFALNMLSIALTIASIAATVYLLSTIDVGKMLEIFKNVFILFGIILGFTIIGAVTKKSAEIALILQGIGAAFLGIGAGVFLLVHSLDPLSKIKDDKFWNAFWKLSALVAAVTIAAAGLLILTTRFNGTQASQLSVGFAAALAGISLAVYSLIPVINLIGDMNDEKAIRGILGVSAILLAMGLVFNGLGKATANAKEGKSSGFWVMIAGIFMIRTLVGAVEAFANMYSSDPTKYIASLTGVIMVLGTLAVIFKVVGEMNLKGKNLVGIVFVAAMIIGTMQVLQTAILNLKDLEWSRTAAILGGFSLIFLSIGAMFALIGKNGDGIGVGAVAAVAALALVMYVLKGTLTAINGMDFKLVESLGKTILMIVASISLLAFVLGQLGAEGSAYAALGIVLVFAGLATGIAILGIAITELLRYSTPVFIETLLSIGDALVTFQELTKDASKERMTEIMDMIRTFADIFLLMGTINYLAVSNFSTQSFRLGVALKSFSDDSSKLNKGKIDISLDVVDAIVKASQKMSKIRKTNTLTKVIGDLGSAVKLYYQSIKGIDSDEYGDSSTFDIGGISQMIVALSEELPDQASVDKILSYTDEDGSLTELALGIVGIGTALKTMSDDLEGVNRQNIQNAIDSLGAIKDIAAGMPTSVEFETAFGTIKINRQTLGDFALDIKAIAEALGELSRCFGDNPEEGKANVTDAITAVGNIADIYKKIVEPNTLAGHILGVSALLESIATKISWESFVGSIDDLGRNVGTMVEKLQSVGFTNVPKEDVEKLGMLLGIVAAVYDIVIKSAFGSGSSSVTINYTMFNDIMKSWAVGNVWDNFVNSFDELATGVSSMVAKLNDPKFKDLDVAQLGKLESILGIIGSTYEVIQTAVSANSHALTGVGDLLTAEAAKGIWTNFVTMLTALGDNMESVADAAAGVTVTPEQMTSFSTLMESVGGLYQAITGGSINDKGLTGIANLLNSVSNIMEWNTFIGSLEAFSDGAVTLVKKVNEIDYPDSDKFKEKIGAFETLMKSVGQVYTAVTTGDTNAAGITGIASILNALGDRMTWKTFIGSLDDFSTGSVGLVQSVIKMEMPTDEEQGSADQKIDAFGKVLGIATDIYKKVLESGATNVGFTAIGAVITSLAENLSWSGFVDKLGDFAKGAKTICDVVLGEDDIFSGVKTYTNTDGTLTNDSSERIDAFKQVMTVVVDIYTAVQESVNKNSSALTGLGKIANAIGDNIAWAGFTGNIQSFAEGVKKLCEVVFGDTFEDVNYEHTPDNDAKIDAFAKTIGVVSTIYGEVLKASSDTSTAITGLGAIANAIGDNTQWKGFTDQIQNFAEGAKKLCGVVFGDTFKDVDFERTTDNEAKISAFAGVLEIVSRIYASIQESTYKYSNAITGFGKIAYAIADNTRWKGFTDQIQNFAEGARKFCDVVLGPSSPLNGMNIAREKNGTLSKDTLAKIKAFGSVLDILAALYDSVLKSTWDNGDAIGPIGDLLVSVAANTSWKGFADQIHNFAEGSSALITEIEKMPDAVSAPDSTKISAFGSIIDILAQLHNSVLTTLNDGSDAKTALGDMLHSLIGMAAWGDFVNKIPDFAANAMILSSAVAGITATGNEVKTPTPEQVALFGSLVTTLANIYNSVVATTVEPNEGFWDGIGSIVTTLMAEETWGAFINSIPAVAKKMNEAIGAIVNESDLDNLTDENLGKFVTLLRAITETYATIGGAPEKVGMTGWDVLVSAFDSAIDFLKDIFGGGKEKSQFEELVDIIAGENSPLVRLMNQLSTLKVDTGTFDLFTSIIDLLTGSVAFNEAVEKARTEDGGKNLKNLSDPKTTVERSLGYISSIMGSIKSINANGLDQGEVDRMIQLLSWVFSIPAQMGTIINSTDDWEVGMGYGNLEAYCNDFNTVMQMLLEDETGQGVFYWLDEINSQLWNHKTRYDDEFVNAMTTYGSFLTGVSRMVKIASDIKPDDVERVNETSGKLVSTVLGAMSQAITDEGLLSNTGAYQTFADLLNSMVTNANSTKSSFKTSGKYMMEGLRNGLRQYANLPKNELADILLKLKDMIPNEFDIESPSKVTEEQGRYIIEGLARGLGENAQSPVAEFADMVLSLADVAEWIAPSLADGVLSKEAMLLQSIQLLGSDMEEALRDQLEIHSRSPLFMGMGEWIPISLSDGVAAKTKQLELQMQNLAMDIVKAFEREGTIALKDVELIEKLLTGGTAEEKKQLDWLLSQYGDMIDAVLPYGKQGILDEALKALGGAGESIGYEYLFTEDGDSKGFVDTLNKFGVGAKGLVAQAGMLKDLAKDLFGIDLGDSVDPEAIKKTLAEKLKGMGLTDLAEKVEGTSASQIVANFGEALGGGFDLNKILGKYGDFDVSQLLSGDLKLEDIPLFSDFVSNIGSTFNDMDWFDEEGPTGSTIKDGDNPTGNDGNGNGNGNGRSGGYGSNGLNVTPGGLLLSSTDGYTIGDIVSRIDRLESAITNMQIVLDSGVLVGAIGPAMDRKLGDYIMFEGRRN